MYAGVPMRTPVDVRSASPNDAIPKSTSFTVSVSSNRMFAGLTSRWMIFASCAALRASSSASAMRRISLAGSTPSRLSRARSDSPRTNSITMKSRSGSTS
jgi:hypothetical protein